jgi:hypothetical protein
MGNAIITPRISIQGGRLDEIIISLFLYLLRIFGGSNKD